MASPNNISLYIAYSKLAQYMSANDISKAIAFKGGSITPKYDRVLYIVRRAVEWKYNNNPTEPSLIQTSDFLWSLIGKYQTAITQMSSGSNCVAPVIISNPSTQSVGAGGNVTFVTVATGTSLTYQWQKNDTNISGATLSTYSINGVANGDAGNYRCVVTNTCGTATTTEAVLTVTAGALIGYYYFGPDDYYTALAGGTDAVPYVGTFPIVDGQPLSVPFPDGASNNMFNITKYPVPQGIKTVYDNHTPNVGSIPDPVYRDIVTIGSFYYIISRNAMSLNSSFPIIFS